MLVAYVLSFFYKWILFQKLLCWCWDKVTRKKIKSSHFDNKGGVGCIIAMRNFLVHRSSLKCVSHGHWLSFNSHLALLDFFPFLTDWLANIIAHKWKGFLYEKCLRGKGSPFIFFYTKVFFLNEHDQNFWRYEVA